MSRNKIAPGYRDEWKGNKRNFERTNLNSDPFFVSQKENKTNVKSTTSGSFFVSKQEKKVIQEKKNELRKQNNKHFNNRNDNRFDNSQGFYKNKSTNFDNKFKGGKIDKRTDKQPFDKKKWRLQKYSKKYKLEQWEDKRKKAVLREYYKEIKDDRPKLDVQKIYEQYGDDTDEETETNYKNKRNYVQNPQYTDINKEQSQDTNQTTSKQTLKGKPKSIAYKKAQSEFKRLKKEKLTKNDEILKIKAEREEALQEYKKKKVEKYKKLNQKTKKGQPIMKGRIEMLLEKIQSS